MGLNAKQKEAVEYLSGPLLVLAGPGTGKTQLLSEKVAYILKNTDTNPENILCLTFTETGASNMRERLKSIIGADGLKVNIGTYHAFGSEILAQYQNYSEDYQRKLDAAIDEVMQFKIIKELQSKLPGNDILRGDNVKDIASVISSAKSAGLGADDLRLIAEQNLEDSKVLSDTISPFLANIVPRVFKESYEKAYLPIWEILKQYTEPSVITKNIERSIGILARDLKDSISEAESLQKIKPLSDWKDKYFEKDSRGNYRLKDRIANKKLLSLAVVMKQYESYLKDNGLYDFDDMIEEAAKVLHDDSGFKATLSERYQFIMLDEFQDTNPSQFAIIKELTDYDNPLIMAVGDDDQAIYEFQGALSTNLIDFQRHYSSNVIPLTENYRSTQEILDFSRKIINQAGDRFADKELVSHQDEPKQSLISRHEFLTSEMEYDFIANEISKLIHSGVKQSEIAVISYKTKYFMPLLPFLKAHPEIHISYEKKDNLLENEQIHELLTLAKFIYALAFEKKTDVSALEVLSYPFFDLPMIEVLKAVGEARMSRKSIFDVLLESDNPKLLSVMNFFVSMITKAFDEPLEIFLDYLIGATEINGYRCPFLSYYTSKGEYQAFSLYESLSCLRGRLNRHYGDRKLRLPDLIFFIDDYEDAEMPINLVSPYRESDESVQLLSAHKAKGLEFSYVFIISADHMAWGKGKGNNNLLALPKNLTQIRHTGTTDGEKLRILYVALTRAKRSIYITNSLHDFNDKSPARLEYFDERQEGEKIVSPLIPSGIVETHYQASAYQSSENNLKNWFLPYVQPSPDMVALYKDRIKNWKMSASSLTSFIDIVYAGPRDFFKNYILLAPSESDDETLVYGNLLHKTFETVTDQGLSDEEAMSCFMTELDKVDLPVDTIKSLREKGAANLAVALKAFGDILKSGKAEVNFAPDKISVCGVPLTGKIDHICIDEDKKTIEIYDYKTGVYHKEKWQSNATLYKYMLQLGFYKLLLNNSLKYRNYTVTKAHILFVTPNNDGEVFDKVYEFTKEDEDSLKQIISAVYQAVSSLKFINDPEVFVESDSQLGIKDIKNFISLLLAKYQK